MSSSSFEAFNDLMVKYVKSKAEEVSFPETQRECSSTGSDERGGGVKFFRGFDENPDYRYSTDSQKSPCSYYSKDETSGKEDEDEDEDVKEVCKHENCTIEKGVNSCINCGKEIIRIISHEKEWRYYGQSDSKRATDPNRVQSRRNEEKNIYKDVDNMGICDKIVSDANTLYLQVTSGQIYRGNSRKAIIFACVFHSLKMSGKPQTHENLIKVFNLSRKTGLKGLKHVNLNTPRESKIHMTFITPIDLIDDVMDKFNATRIQKCEVMELFEKINNRSSNLNRARPQSVTAGLIYYWIVKKKIDVTIKEFISKVNLSELTVYKVYKEIITILDDSTSAPPSSPYSREKDLDFELDEDVEK